MDGQVLHRRQGLPDPTAGRNSHDSTPYPKLTIPFGDWRSAISPCTASRSKRRRPDVVSCPILNSVIYPIVSGFSLVREGHQSWPIGRLLLRPCGDNGISERRAAVTRPRRGGAGWVCTPFC